MNNVNLWYAKNDEGKMVTVDKLSDDYKGKYYCPLCGSEVIPKAIESESISSHFAHMDKSKCSSESIVHWWVKHELIKEGDKFTIVTDKEEEYICKTIDIEKQYEIDDITYKPDATVITEDDKIIFIEINFTNKKKYKDYYEIWDKIGNTVIEFNAKEHLSEDNVIKINNNLKSVYYSGMIYKIDENSDDYIKYRKSINNIKESLQYSDEILNELKWFMDDLYRVTNMIDDDIHMISRGLKEISKKGGRYKDFIKDIYKINRCSNVLKDVVEFRDDLLQKAIYEFNEVFNEYNINVNFDSWANKRFISDRLFGSVKIEFDYMEYIEKINENYEYSDMKDYFSCVYFSYAESFFELSCENFKYDLFINDLDEVDECLNNAIENIKNEINKYETRCKNWNKTFNKLSLTENDYIIKRDICEYIRVMYSIRDFYQSIYGNINTCEMDIIKEIESEILGRAEEINLYNRTFINVSSPTFSEGVNKILNHFSSINKRCSYIKDIIKNTHNYKNNYVLTRYNNWIGYEITINNIKIRINNDNIVNYGDLRITKLTYCNDETFINEVIRVLEFIIDGDIFKYDIKTLDILHDIKRIYKYKTDIKLKVCLEMDEFKLYDDNKVISKALVSNISTCKDLANKFSDDVRFHKYGVK